MNTSWSISQPFVFLLRTLFRSITNFDLSCLFLDIHLFPSPPFFKLFVYFRHQFFVRYMASKDFFVHLVGYHYSQLTLCSVAWKLFNCMTPLVDRLLVLWDWSHTQKVITWAFILKNTPYPFLYTCQSFRLNLEICLEFIAVQGEREDWLSFFYFHRCPVSSPWLPKTPSSLHPLCIFGIFSKN